MLPRSHHNAQIRLPFVSPPTLAYRVPHSPYYPEPQEIEGLKYFLVVTKRFLKRLDRRPPIFITRHLIITNPRHPNSHLLRPPDALRDFLPEPGKVVPELFRGVDVRR